MHICIIIPLHYHIVMKFVVNASYIVYKLIYIIFYMNYTQQYSKEIKITRPPTVIPEDRLNLIYVY